MDEAKLAEMLLTAVAGPAAATVVSLICMFSFGYVLIKHILPRQDKTIDAFVKESRENRKTFQEAITVMASRLDRVEEDVTYVKAVIVEKARNKKEVA